MLPNPSSGATAGNQKSPLNTVDARRVAEFRQSPIDGQTIKRLIEAGLTWLRTNQAIVNALNVFPVPDGDTGTNMVLTMQSAFDEIADSPEQSLGKMAHMIAHGALMGARGNSGVILSQILRGLARAMDGRQQLDGASLVQALEIARDTAYKGVVRPVEGTILTVAKDIAAAGRAALADSSDPVSILEKVVAAADASVAHTPELLPVLKDAGVVDSGGKGLFFIYEGMLRYIYGQPLDKALISVQPLSSLNLENTMESIEPGQDFEVVVDFQPFEPLDLVLFYDRLEQMGTSIQLGEGDGMYRLHIHVPTENLYTPLDYTRSLGVVTKAAIENLNAQMEGLQNGCSDRKIQLSPIEAGQIAVVAVVPGSGLARVFASLGVAALVQGGQTMNPSTQEIIHAFENLPTDKIIILPNNKNIHMAAQSAAELTVKNVAVIPSRNIPQGLAAMLRLAPNAAFDDVVDEMKSALDEIECGEITIATRSVEIDGVQVQEGEIIGLHNGKLVEAATSMEDACLGLLRHAHADHFELITLFYGEDVSRKEADQIADQVRLSYPDQEVEVQEGCQPHYRFIISIE